MTCALRHDLSIIRGDTFNLHVGLASGWENIAQDPSLYEGRLVFRERQDDSLPELLAITTTPEPIDEHRFPQLDFMLDLSMTPAETESLPTYPVVCFCEIRLLDGSYVRRLFEGRVRQRD
jgi:hypothetical protein